MSKLLRTKIPRDKFGDKDVVWLPDLYTIDEIIAKTPLPVLVKVIHGYMINDLESLARNTILSIHGYRRIKKFIATDQQESHMKIPVTCKYEAMVRPNVTIPLCKTAGDVCRQPKLPNFIMNEIEFRSNGKIFPAYSTFLVKSVGKGGTLSVVCLTQKAYKTKLDASAKGHFRETVHPNDRNKRYLMKDLVNRDLPLSVEFQPHSRDSINYSPRMGTVRLKELTANDVVYATTYDAGHRLLITFSRTLDIKLQIGHIMVEADGELYSTIAEPTEDEIDEKVLYHAFHLNPYNADYIGIDYDLATQQLYADKHKGPSVNPSRIENLLTVQRVHETSLHETKPLDLPERPSPSLQQLPRVPPRNRTEENNNKHSIEEPAPLGDNQYQATENLDRSYETKGIATQQTLLNLSHGAPHITRPKPELKSPKDNTKHVSDVVAPTQRRYTLDSSNTASSPQHLGQIGKPNNRYQELPHPKSFPIDISVQESTSADTKEPKQASEKIILRRQTSTPIGTTLTSSNSALSVANNNNPSSNKRLPTDTTLMTTKLPQMRAPIAAYEEIASPSGNVPTDTSVMSIGPRQVTAPSPAYEEINLSKETLPAYTRLTSSTLRTMELSPAPLAAETQTHGRELSQSHEIHTRHNSAAAKEAPRNEDDVIDRTNQCRSYQGQTSVDGKMGVEAKSIETTTNSDQTGIDLAFQELTNKDVDGICDMLDKLQLGKFKESFISNQIDGELLIEVSEKDLVSDLGMTLFQARKINQYMRGWRPDEERSDYHEQIENEDRVPQTSEEDTDKPVETWLVEDVCKRMLSIKLNSFADFCKENQVNGSLLKIILDNDVIDSVRTDHNVSLSGIEEKKLVKYVSKGWRPKSIKGSAS